jgi:hypothetical protein
MRPLRSIVQRFLPAALLAMTYAPHCAGAAPSLSLLYSPPGASAMTADIQGNIYLTGTTTGSLPATQGGAQPQYPGALCPQPAFFGPPPPPLPCTAAFALKLQASTGTVAWATYLGGYTNDGGTGIAVDPEGNVYVAGYTNGHFPTTAGSYMPGSSGGMFAVKVSADGGQLVTPRSCRARPRYQRPSSVPISYPRRTLPPTRKGTPILRARHSRRPFLS